ncbi:MAG: NAD(P)H-dependent oxidoreductase [Pseudomonadota bacterium]
MRALVVYSHPRPQSFTAAVRDLVVRKLLEAGAEVRVRDLYAEGFDPRLTSEDWECYEDEATNCDRVSDHVDDIRWCDALIFVYPTWWYGLPAMMKGWLDRVLLPGVAFAMPELNKGIRPKLTHITRLGVFTTCGATWWLTRWIGSPGRRTLLRGVRILCAPRTRTAFAAQYLMDSSTDAARAVHLARVGRKMDKLIGRGSQAAPARPATA